MAKVWRLTLARRIQLQIGLAIAIVIVAVTSVGYVQTVGSMRDEALSNLQSVTRARAAMESTSFLEAQQNTQAVRDEFLRRLKERGSNDPRSQFDAWFVKYPDGLIRVRPERDDHQHLPSIYIRAPVKVDAQLRREVVTAFELMREWGPAQTLRYFSTYIDLPGKSLIMFSPSVNWGKEADITTNNFDYPPVQNSAPGKNPQRKTQWTEVYLDDKAKTWMLSVITPMDQDGWLGTASQDIAVEDLIHRTTNQFASGTYNLVMDRQGKLVAHPALMEKIRQSSGNLNINTLGDATLAEIFERSQESTQDVAIGQTSDASLYLGIARIQGPDWYFVTVYPKALLEQKGLASARAILVAGLVGLVLELALLAWILHRQIALPLKALSHTTRAVAGGNMEVDVALRGKGELGALADHFVDMLQRLRERDAALVQSEALKSTLLEAARVNELKVTQVLTASPLPITVANFATGVYVDVNPAWERQFQRSKNEVVGKSSVDLGFWRDMQDRQGWIERFNADGRVSDYEVTFVMRDGRPRIFMISSERFKYGHEDCVLTMSVDVTERKQLELDLKGLNVHLEERIARRTHELERSNTSLKETLQNLELARDELVRREKLAALGSLVAGVSHELNTPIGNSLTVASTLEHQVAAFSGQVAKGLTRSALNEFVVEVREGVDILMRSLRRAVELVSGFKQVAVDQTSENRRAFNLHETTSEILLTLGPSIRRTPHTVVSDIPQGITMQSYPGPLGQVLTNLINNALIHGLADKAHGHITLAAAALREGWIELSVRDDGIGIDPEHLGRVFDPFFTTRLGQGGSGLGLNIVYNIVTRTLGGAIRVESKPGLGTCFTLQLPCNGPMAQEI